MAGTTNTGSFLDLQYKAIEEVLARDVQFFLPEQDPIYSKIVHQTGGTGDQNQIGRDMHIKKTYYSGYSGVIEQGSATENFVLYGDAGGAAVGEKLHTQNVSNSWPDPTLGYAQAPIGLTIPLRASLTNLLWTLGELQTEALPAYIASSLSPKLKGFANNVAHTSANYLYLSQSDNFQLFTCADVSVDATIVSNKTLRISPSNLACARVNVGMRLNQFEGSTAYGSDGNAVAGLTQEIVVTAVDRLKNTIDLRWRNDATWVENTNFKDGNIFCFPGQKASSGFLGYAGLNSWMRSSGNLLGGESIAATTRGGGGEIDVQTHPEFKSGTWNFNGKPLTEHRMRQICRRFNMAHMPYGHSIDTLVASDGVWLAYERQNHGKEMLDRTGRLATVQSGQGTEGDGYGGFKFTMDGKTLTGLTSAYVDAGTVYGIKTAGGNWKMVTPPDYSGLQKDASIGGKYAGFRFIGPALNNGGGIKFPIYKNSSSNLSMITEGMQTPGMIRQQLIPDNPAGIKLTNVEEDRLFSDS